MKNIKGKVKRVNGVSTIDKKTTVVRHENVVDDTIITQW